MTGSIHFAPWSKPTGVGQFWLFSCLQFPTGRSRFASPVTTNSRSLRAGPVSVAIGVDGYSPPCEQQFRDVATVFVALTPLPQFYRVDTSLLVQSELLELFLEGSRVVSPCPHHTPQTTSYHQLDERRRLRHSIPAYPSL